MDYYHDAAAWAWEATRLFANANIYPGAAIALISTLIAAMVVKRLGEPARVVALGGLVGAIGGPAIVMIAAFFWHFLQYPVVHTDDFSSLSRRVTVLEQKPVAVPDLESRLSALERINIAMTKLPWFQRKKLSIDEAAADYEQKTNDLLSGYINNTIVFPGRMMMYIDGDARRIEQIAKSAGLNVNLDAHPNFDKNPALPLKEEEKITDPAKRAEFRLYKDQFHTALATIADIKNKLEGQILAIDKEIEGYGNRQ